METRCQSLEASVGDKEAAAAAAREDASERTSHAGERVSTLEEEACSLREEVILFYFIVYQESPSPPQNKLACFVYFCLFVVVVCFCVCVFSGVFLLFGGVFWHVLGVECWGFLCSRVKGYSCFFFLVCDHAQLYI